MRFQNLGQKGTGQMLRYLLGQEVTVCILYEA